jgi:uncharacterized protein YciI
MAIFVATMVNGPGYDTSRPRREQSGWDEHAVFMNALVDEGFVILGGPIGDGAQVMLVIDAKDADEIEERLASDPWASQGVLRIGTLQPWTLWLDGRAAR